MTVSNERLKFLMEEMDEKDLVEEVYEEIRKGEFLVPVILPEDLKNQTMAKGEFSVDEETPVSIRPLQDEEGKIYLPVFTDTSETSKSNEETTVIVFAIDTIRELIFKQNDELEGVVINPFSEYVLNISRDTLMEL